VTVASDGTTLGLGGGTVWQFTQNSSKGWDGKALPGGGILTQISCGSASTLWGIGADGKSYYQFNGSIWVQVTGSGKQVSAAADGTAWAIGTDNSVSRYVNNAWTPLLV